MGELKKKVTNEGIDERKVIKVDTPAPVEPPIQEPPVGSQMPPEQGQQPMEQPTFDDGQGDGQDEYDTDFNAGVEADEDSDPKRYIQQLTGKLSQKLRTYNSELPSPDTDLNKYVAGMINKQAIEGLDNKDVKEILSKIKSDETMDDEPDDGDEMDADDESDDFNADDMQQESVDRRKINELFQNITQGDNDEPIVTDTDNNGDSYRRQPFMPPSFQK